MLAVVWTYWLAPTLLVADAVTLAVIAVTYYRKVWVPSRQLVQQRAVLA